MASQRRVVTAAAYLLVFVSCVCEGVGARGTPPQSLRASLPRSRRLRAHAMRSASRTNLDSGSTRPTALQTLTRDSDPVAPLLPAQATAQLMGHCYSYDAFNCPGACRGGLAGARRACAHLTLHTHSRVTSVADMYIGRSYTSMGYFDYAGGRFREDDLITVTDEVDVAYEQARLAWRPLPAAVVCAVDLRVTSPIVTTVCLAVAVLVV